MMDEEHDGIIRHRISQATTEQQMPNNEIQNLKQYRFALLLHESHDKHGEEHYDLLLEIPGQEKLMAWHLSHERAEPQRIADHRKIYMKYEGEIPGGRGTVKRIAKGMATVLEIDEKKIRIRLEVKGMTEVEIGVGNEIVLPL